MIATLGPSLLGMNGIAKKLMSLDPSTVTEDIMVQLEDILAEGDLTVEKIERSCSKAMGLFEWVMAIRNYYYVYRHTVPLRDKVIQADLQM